MNLSPDNIITRNISITRAKEHNLKSVSVNIPRDKLVVITGLSGSGKSSLAFDTIYAEGQRRYIESLSVYARQFLDQLKKPDVEEISGLTPTIAVEQRTGRSTPRSTIATMTEIYDYLRLLYSRIGILHCPKCKKILNPQSAENIVNDILNLKEGTKIQIMSPLVRSRKGEFKELSEKLIKDGFIRIRVDGTVFNLEEFPQLDKNIKHTIELIIDRIIIKPSSRSRMYDSIEIALKKGNGLCLVVSSTKDQDIENEQIYSEHFSCPDHGTVLEEISPRVFSFNSPYGACDQCFGLGTMLEPEETLVIPDSSLSLEEGAIAAWKKCGSAFNLFYQNSIKKLANLYNIKTTTPWEKIDSGTRNLILHGDASFEGIFPNLIRRFNETISTINKQRIHEYLSNKQCSKCNGSRLRSEVLAITIDRLNIFEITDMNVEQALIVLNKINIKGEKKIIAQPILNNIIQRLNFLVDVGLTYLKLNRATNSLSGGEFQRIKLASHIGGKLSGVTYVLDEPTIGLHQRDNYQLINSLKKLRDLGNTLIVVEHDEDIIRNADYILDIGPKAGVNGGEIIAQGSYENIINSNESLTSNYLSGKKVIKRPNPIRKLNKEQVLSFKSCQVNNLKNINVDIPLSIFSCVTGVSGAGKSSLVLDCIAEGLTKYLVKGQIINDKYKSVKGINKLERVVIVNQSSIGKTPRSNPATYTGLFDHVRKLFAKMPDAIATGYTPSRFSFNVKGGRCESCFGQGVKTVEMHFLPNVYVECESCVGKRYNSETLKIKYKGKNIAEVLDMSIEEAEVFFRNQPMIYPTLKLLNDIGLGYLKLGQSSVTLSGGEAQRIKLCSELSKRIVYKTLYVMDEPTTGLHFHDITKLLKIIDMLVEKKATVLVIEHNLDVIKCADWVIDIGPDGGDNGGNIVVVGTPDKISKCKDSITGHYLKRKLIN